MLGYRDGVFILVMIFYVIALPFVIMLFFRHGWQQWRPLLVFSLARILAAGFYFGTINNPDNKSLWAAYTTTIGIAVSVLLVSILSALLQTLRSISPDRSPLVFKKDTKALSTFLLVGLILGIVGAVNTNTKWGHTGIYQISALTKVSVGIFIASWVLIVLYTVQSIRRVDHMTARQRALIRAIFAALVLVFPRIVYSAISAFHYNHTFSLIYGSTTILLCMALLEEMGVTIALLVIGFFTPKAIPASGTQLVTTANEELHETRYAKPYERS